MTRKPKTYRTSPEFFELPSDVRYDLVTSTVGNDTELARDEDNGLVTLAWVDYEDVRYTLVIGWDSERNGYEVIAEPFTPARS